MPHPYDLLGIPGCPGRLLFTPCPGTQDTSLDAALATLQQAGASAVISLMPPSELAACGVEQIADRCRALGLDWFQLPVADEQVPLDDFDAAWEVSRQKIRALLDDGRGIAIHCKGGSGRTGLIAARILIDCGIARSAAVALVQALRPKAIRHPAHVGWLAQFDAT